MRVLLVHNFYQIPGGEDAIVQADLAMLRANGIAVELFAADNSDIKGLHQKALVGLRTVYNWPARVALAEKLKEFAPDVVHVHNFFPMLSPSIFDACVSAGIPAVMTLHNFRILCPAGLLHPDATLREQSLHHSCWWTVPRRAYRNSATATLALAAMVEYHKRVGTWSRKVNRFIALTPWAKQMFTEGGLPAERIVVKPNCVARPPAFSHPQRHGALFVGRLDEQKGVRVLLRAWRDIDYPLTIIGDGPLSDLVRHHATDRITYLARQPREVVQREMSAAQFLVLPSVGHEMFPVTVLEAFSSRLPVICSDLPSLAGLVEDGKTGRTFPPGDANALAALVRRAVSNELALAGLALRAHSIYEERFTPEAGLTQLIAIYQTVRNDPLPRLSRPFGQETRATLRIGAPERREIPDEAR